MRERHNRKYFYGFRCFGRGRCLRDSTSRRPARRTRCPRSHDLVSADAYIHLVGTGDSDSNVNQLSNDIHQWNIRDTFSLQHRNHMLKFGIDQQHVSST